MGPPPGSSSTGAGGGREGGRAGSDGNRVDRLLAVAYAVASADAALLLKMYSACGLKDQGVWLCVCVCVCVHAYICMKKVCGVWAQ